jgi:hypothetical protein
MSDEQDETTIPEGADYRLRLINSVVAAPLSDPDSPNINTELDTREYIDKELVTMFNGMVRLAEHVDPKQKFLWQRIFKNAIDDRRIASVLLMDLYINTVQDADKHVMHGDLLSKYMERMEKANQQIIKLSEIVQKAIDVAPAPVHDEEKELLGMDIYDVLEKNSGKPAASGKNVQQTKTKSR